MIFKKNAKNNDGETPRELSTGEATHQHDDLLKMKKKDLLEIMLEQGREIDRLRARVSELEKELEDRNFDFEKIGSLAEASLYITDVFKEADKAAITYLQNVRRKHEQSGDEGE